MRLGGWQRVGVVLSVLWVIFAAIYLQVTVNESNAKTRAMYYGWCMEDSTAGKLPKSTDCYAYAASQMVPDSANWWVFPLLAMVPLTVAWIFVYVVVWVTRWVRAGFRPAA